MSGTRSLSTISRVASLARSMSAFRAMLNSQAPNGAPRGSNLGKWASARWKTSAVNSSAASRSRTRRTTNAYTGSKCRSYRSAKRDGSRCAASTRSRSSAPAMSPLMTKTWNGRKGYAGLPTNPSDPLDLPDRYLNREWFLQRGRDGCAGRDHHFVSARGRDDARAAAGTDGCAHRGAFLAAGNRADDRASRRADADLLRVFPLGRSGDVRDARGMDVEVLIVHSQTVEGDRER